MNPEKLGKIQEECKAQSPKSRSTYYRHAPTITLQPRQIQSGDPVLGPIECHTCGKKFYILTYLPTIEKLDGRKGTCPFDECEAVFHIEIEKPEPEPPPKKRFLIPKRRR